MFVINGWESDFFDTARACIKGGVTITVSFFFLFFFSWLGHPTLSPQSSLYITSDCSFTSVSYDQDPVRRKTRRNCFEGYNGCDDETAVEWRQSNANANYYRSRPLSRKENVKFSFCVFFSFFFFHPKESNSTSNLIVRSFSAEETQGGIPPTSLFGGQRCRAYIL